MRFPRFDADAERGTFIALAATMVYYALFSSTYDWGVVHSLCVTRAMAPNAPLPGCNINPLAYGVLWYALNPLFFDRFLWGLMTMCIYFAMFGFQRWLVKKGKLNKGIVYLNMFSVALFETVGVQRDVTVVMFAPLVTMNPLFLGVMVLEKLGLGWSWNLSDIHWRTTVEQISWGKVGIPGQPGIFEAQYVMLMLWFIVPLMYWLGKRLWRRWK